MKKTKKLIDKWYGKLYNRIYLFTEAAKYWRLASKMTERNFKYSF